MIERKNINQGSVALISWLIIVVLNFFQLLYVKFTIPGKFDWNDVLYYAVTSLTMGVLLIYFFLLPIFRRIRKLRVGFQIPLFIFHGLTYTSIYIFLIFFQIALWSENLAMDELFETVHRFFYTDFHNIAKNYFFLLAIYIAVEYINKREETLMQQKALEDQLMEVKIQALEARLHPHFLFNTLNGIIALVKENPDKAEEAIVELSNLLRFTLESNFQDPISINEELIILGMYVSIEKMRFEDQLIVDISISDDVDKNRPILPPMILQPIIENAVIHGFRGMKAPLTINGIITPSKIKVKNNGAALSQNIEYGNGFKIVEQRLKRHFGNQVELVLMQEDAFVVCEIKGVTL